MENSIKKTKIKYALKEMSKLKIIDKKSEKNVFNIFKRNKRTL